MNTAKKLQVFIIFLFLFGIFTKAELLSWNDKSRIDTIRSLVEHHTFIIDNIISNPLFTTGDKYLYNNHFYSDKPPLLSIYGAGVYLFLKNLFNISFENHYKLASYLITLLTIGILSSLSLVWFYKILIEEFKIDEKWSDITILTVGTGTLVLPYSIAFNNHIVSGSLLLLSFYYLLKSKDNKIYSTAATGIIISLAGNIDLNCFLFVPFCFLYFLMTKSFKSGAIFILSCVPLIAIYFWLNFYLSGSIIPPATNPVLWDYPGSVFNKTNLSGLATHYSGSDLIGYAFNMILGSRGLISHTPILLFSIFALTKIFRLKHFQYKTEYLYISTASLAFILIYIFRTKNYSGLDYGVRWFATPMLLLCLPLAHIGNEIRRSRVTRILFVVTATLSIILSFVGTYDPFVRNLITLQLPLLGTFNSDYTFIISTSLIATHSSTSYKLRLIFSAFIIYFLFRRLLKNLKSSNP